MKPSPLQEKQQPDCTPLFTISQTCRTQGKTREDWEYGGWISLEMVKFTDSLCSPLPAQNQAMREGKSEPSDEEWGYAEP